MSENTGNIAENKYEIYWANHYELYCDDIPDLQLTCHKAQLLIKEASTRIEALFINDAPTRIEASFYVTDTTLPLLFGNPLFGINTEHHITLKLFKSDGSLVTTLYDGTCILKEKKTSLESIPNCTGNNPLSVTVTFEDN